MKYYIGIDCGGTLIKAALYTHEGREVGVRSVETEMQIPKPGFAERDMDVLRDAVFEVIGGLIRSTRVDSAQIEGIACCGHGKGLYLWGHDDRPVRAAILSADNRAFAYPVKWKQDGTEDRVFEISLQHIMACQPVSLLAWLRDNEPEAIEKTRWIFECKDYVRYILTGEAYAELTDYSGANLVNLHTKKYDSSLLDCFGLSEIMEKLPPLRGSTDICGMITRQVAEKTGLVEGTPVAGGMFDIDACAIAVDAASQERLCVIAGTWSINQYIRKKPVTDRSVKMNSIFCDDAYYLIEESSATSAVNNEWFIRTLLPELMLEAAANGESVYDICNDAVGLISPEEFSPIFLPFLFASNVHPNAKGCFVGMSSHHTRGHLIRGVYEGVAYCHKYHIDKLLQSRDEPPECVRLAGGVARSTVWSQMFADVLQIPVETVDVNETGALGCAITAAVATGHYASFGDAAHAMSRLGQRYEPDSQNAACYAARYGIYRKVIQAIDPVWDEIQSLI